MYGNEDSSLPATYQVLYFIGWKPDASQVQANLCLILNIRYFSYFFLIYLKPEPKERGSGQVSLKDISQIVNSGSNDKKPPNK